MEKPRVLKVAPMEGKDPIFIEVTEVEGEGGMILAGGDMKSFEEMFQKIKPFCESIISNLKELSVKPDSASVEFGINLSAGFDLFVVQASGKATLKVTLNWRIN